MKTNTNINTNTNRFFPSVAELADRLGALKAQMADLKVQEEALKGALVASGAATIEGDEYRVAVSRVDERPVVDWRAMAESYNPSRETVDAYTTYAEPYSVVRVSARTGKK